MTDLPNEEGRLSKYCFFFRPSQSERKNNATGRSIGRNVVKVGKRVLVILLLAR